MSRNRKSRVWKRFGDDTEASGMHPDQLPARDRDSSRDVTHSSANCLNQSVLNSSAVVAEIMHVLSCPMCAALVEVHHEINEDRKNPLVLDFRPSEEWVRKLAEACTQYLDAPVRAERGMQKIRTRCGAEVVKHIATTAYITRSSQTPSFVVIENGIFCEITPGLFDSALRIPESDMGNEVHKLLAREFMAWIARRGNDFAVGHRALDRLVVEGDKVVGYVTLEPAIPWPIHC